MVILIMIMHLFTYMSLKKKMKKNVKTRLLCYKQGKRNTHQKSLFISNEQEKSATILVETSCKTHNVCNSDSKKYCNRAKLKQKKL